MVQSKMTAGNVKRKYGMGKTKSEAVNKKNYSDARPLKCFKRQAGGKFYTTCNRDISQNERNAGSSKSKARKSERIVQQRKAQEKKEAKPLTDKRTRRFVNERKKDERKEGRPLTFQKSKKAQEMKEAVPLRKARRIVKRRIPTITITEAPRMIKKSVRKPKVPPKPKALKGRKLNKDGTPRKVRADKGKRRK